MKQNIEIGEVVDINMVKKSDYQMHDCTRQSNLALMRSVVANGQLRAIIINEKGEILDGNRLYDAMLRIGYKKVWILRRSTKDNDRCISVAMNLRTVFDKVRPETIYTILKNNEEVLNYIPYPRAQMARWRKDMESVEFDKVA